jgi:hypothetical protein
MHLDSLSWNDALADEDINQPLQRFHILLREQVVVHCNGHEVHEAAVELQVAIDVPERIVPVTVVEMGVTSEHLLDDALDILVEIRREAGGFADPVLVTAGERGHGLVEVRWRRADGRKVIARTA